MEKYFEEIVEEFLILPLKLNLSVFFICSWCNEKNLTLCSHKKDGVKVCN